MASFSLRGRQKDGPKLGATQQVLAVASLEKSKQGASSCDGASREAWRAGSATLKPRFSPTGAGSGPGLVAERHSAEFDAPARLSLRI